MIEAVSALQPLLVSESDICEKLLSGRSYGANIVQVRVELSVLVLLPSHGWGLLPGGEVQHWDCLSWRAASQCQHSRSSHHS